MRIQNIMILNDDRGANNDGIDPDCCQDVVISNCIVRTGDDAIVVKSTGRCPAATVQARMWPSRAASYIPAILR